VYIVREKELVQLIDQVTQNYKGNLHELESAIGMLMVGRQFGWKVMLLVHDKKTIRKYERMLGVDVREVLPEVGDFAHKSLAWVAAQKVGNFWKAVKGEIAGIRTPEATN